MEELRRERADYTDWCLTPRRREVVMGIRSFKSNKEIAKHMGVSIHTVKNHVHWLLRRYGLQKRHELVKLLGPESVYDPLDIKHLCRKIESLEGAIIDLAGQLGEGAKS